MKFLIFVFLSFPLFSLADLICSKVIPIQKAYLNKHVSHRSFSKKLQNRTIDQFIKNVDRGKFYFIQPDIELTKKWFQSLFKDLEEGDCTALNKFYDLYYKRMKEHYEFAKLEISNPEFKLDENTTIVLDVDKRNFSRSHWQLKNFHKKYIQYELASILSVEKDIEKAKKHLLGMYKRKLKAVESWDPQPSDERLKFCLQKERKNKLVKTCKIEKWYSVYLDSFARSLDPHSSYLSRYELDDFRINMELSLEGIGASLSSRYGYTTIEKLLPGGAAHLSKKIKRKDKIIAIGQKPNHLVPIFGWDLRDVVEMVRGKKGTRVYLKILRDLKNGDQKKFVVNLVRKKIHLKDSASSIIHSTQKINGEEKKVGVIRVPSFYGGNEDGSGRSVSRDIRQLINQSKDLDALVLDLSNNGGGVLSEAVEVAGLFFKKANIVRQMTKNKARKSVFYTLRDDDNKITYKGPLVVLIDRGSASASEIVAGALKDYKRAVVVGGDHTFGKGSIQSVENVGRRLGATKTTVGLFYIPSGKSTQKRGVDSDIVFPSLSSMEEYGEKTLDYVLPQSHTTSFLTKLRNVEWTFVNPSVLKQLEVKAKLRIKESSKFKEIQQDIAEYKKEKKEDKAITIKNFLAEFQKRSEEEQELEEEFLDLDTNDPDFKKKYLERANVSEAVNIAFDIITMNQRVLGKN